MSEFKVKFALQKRSKTSPKSIMALQNMKKWTKKIIWHFGICPKQCTTDRSTSLVCVQLKKRGFEKNSLTKVMEIFNSYYAENSFRGMCKNIRHFSLLTISFIFVLGFAFGSDSCVSKIGICLSTLWDKVFTKIIVIWTTLIYAHCTGCITPCFWIPTINQYLQFQGMIVLSSSAN